MAAPQLLRDVGLDAVVGMYPVVHRLRTTVVAPWRASADPAVRPPRRVLLHGVPGSGATFIAERLADELERTCGVPAVVVDSLDADAARDPDEVVALLSGPETRSSVVIAVSHAPWALHPALFDDATGFDRLAFVPPPDWDARRFRIWETPWGGRLDNGDLDQLVAATEGWAGTDLALLGGLGADGEPSVAELLAAASAGATDTDEWLANARDLISAFDGVGRLDDLVGYLQRYRLL